MEVNRLSASISSLKILWANQNIPIKSSSEKEIKRVEMLKKIKLPNDLKFFYSEVNGMNGNYPDDMDDNGFLFYPVQHVLPYNKEFNSNNLDMNAVYIFAEYLHKSWWYAFKNGSDSNTYRIMVIFSKDDFRFISNSLAEFIELYLCDSPALYK